MHKISYHPSFGEYAFDISPEERAAMKRYSMGFFQGAPAMFEHLDGKYVKWEDVRNHVPALAAKASLQAVDIVDGYGYAYHKYVLGEGSRDACMDARELLLAAIRPMPHQPTLTERLQRKCSEWGAYWRAPDAHGVVLTQEQALELLRDALGVEVNFKQGAGACNHWPGQTRCEWCGGAKWAKK